ncbi:MAG: DUF72 domain-containing protein [Planctomycetes bacterium]|nr:DUF72 domain-containing protein [Planctomycetota bacterium]
MSTGEQWSLFGGSAEEPAVDGAVSPCAPDPALAALGASLPASVRLGTSSWSFPGWKGLVYAGRYSESALARDGLRAYGQHPLLRTVGVDKTYYRPAPLEEFMRLAAQVPHDFRFLVKAHESIMQPTQPLDGWRPAPGAPHRPSRWLDAAFATDEMVAPCVGGLAERCGPILFQFSHLGVRHDSEAEHIIDEVGEFLARLPPGPLYAIEWRDRRMLRPSYLRMLRSTGASHCYSVHPSMPDPMAQAEQVPVDANRVLCCRWMLHSGLSYEEAKERYAPFDCIVDPDPAGLAAWVRLNRSAATAGIAGFVIVNNKAEGSSPRSVERLARALHDDGMTRT